MTTAYVTPLLAALEELAPPDHLCSIYETEEEHHAVAMPFVRIGLERGEKCIYIADDGTEAAVRDAMHAGGIDVDRALAKDSLVLEKKETAYLKNGSFDPNWMFTFWADATADAHNKGLHGVARDWRNRMDAARRAWPRAVDGVRKQDDTDAGWPQLRCIVPVQPPPLFARAHPRCYSHAPNRRISRGGLSKHVLRAARGSARSRPGGARGQASAHEYRRT